MKKIFFTTIFFLLVTTNISLSMEKTCSQYDKWKESYKYRKCKAALESEKSEKSLGLSSLNEKYKALRKKLAPKTGSEMWKNYKKNEN